LLIGAPLHLTAVVLTMFGMIDRIGSVAAPAALPIAVRELSLGVYLIVRGPAPSPTSGALKDSCAMHHPSGMSQILGRAGRSGPHPSSANRLMTEGSTG